ncbi:hypothetical protein [Diaphorobacter nitroreducens]
MSLKNTSAIKRGADLRRHQLAQQAKQTGLVKIDKPNRQQRRAAEKQERKQ